MTPFLLIAFFVTAILYASVGFGGGSTYNALLVLAGADYQVLPTIALTCNIVVVFGSVVHFWRNGVLQLSPILPLLVASVPAAMIGGRLEISETVFVGLLGFSLLLSGVRMAIGNISEDVSSVSRPHNFLILALLGASLGLLSGMVGIGGGIFLAPLLYFLNWGSARKIASTCSLFILANSISGLIGQTMKLSEAAVLMNALSYWPLVVSVFLGGQIGSWAISQKFSHTTIKRLTAVLILYVAIRLLYRWVILIQ